MKNKHITKRPRLVFRTVMLSLLVLTLLVGSSLGFDLYRIFEDPAALFNTAYASDSFVAESTQYQGSMRPLFAIQEEKGTVPYKNRVFNIPGLGYPSSQTILDTGKVVLREGEETETIDGSGIVNILLMGIDRKKNGWTTSGTQPHTDAMLLVSVNFNEKKIHLITMPRDILTTTPGYRGFYKLNGTYNVGGGTKKAALGCEQVCRTIEEWLGVSIPYFYAVDFTGAVLIADAMGGIDYDSEIPYEPWPEGWKQKGQQHMDGADIVGYMRIRKKADGTDRSRTDRQRRMMKAIFTKLYDEGNIVNAVEYLKAAGRNLWTNTTETQTLALARFLTQIKPEDIELHVVDGKYLMGKDWAFSYNYQQERIDLVKDIFGVDVGVRGFDSLVYEEFLHQNGFTGLKHIVQAEMVLKNVKTEFKKKANLSEEQIEKYTACYRNYIEMMEAYQAASDWYEEHYENGGSCPHLGALQNAEKNLEASVTALAKVTGYSDSLNWKCSSSSWYNDSYINEVYVDFR